MHNEIKVLFKSSTYVPKKYQSVYRTIFEKATGKTHGIICKDGNSIQVKDEQSA